MPRGYEIFNKKIIFLDFNGYPDPSNKFCVKECYAVSLSAEGFNPSVEKHFIFIDDRNHAQWPERLQDGVKAYLNRFGIPLELGKHILNRQSQHLRKYLKPALEIYVESDRKMQVLYALLGNDLNLRSLEKLNYRPSIENVTCQWHTLNRSRCSKTRAISMLRWFTEFKRLPVIGKVDKRKFEGFQVSPVDETHLMKRPLKKRKYVQSSSSSSSSSSSASSSPSASSSGLSKLFPDD